MENFSDEFERSLQETFRDAELEPSDSLWENIVTSSDLNSNSFEGSFQDVFSEAEMKPSDEVWKGIAQSPELQGSLEHQFGAVFTDATLKPPSKVWANIEKQLHQKWFPKRMLWRVGGVAASLLLISGIWWNHSRTNDLLVESKKSNPVHQQKSENPDNSLQLNEEKFDKNSTSIVNSESNLETSSVLEQENIASTKEEIQTPKKQIVEEDLGNQGILSATGYQKKSNTDNFVPSTKKDELIAEKSTQAKVIETPKKLELLIPIQQLDAGLILAVNDFGEPVFVITDAPIIVSKKEKAKIRIAPFIGFSGASENFTPNFTGNNSAIEKAVQLGDTPFTQGVNSFDNDLHLALADNLQNIQSVRYGLDFGLNFENIIKSGIFSFSSGLYLTESSFSVQSDYVRKLNSSAQSSEQILENTLQNRTQLVSVPMQIILTSKSTKSNWAWRLGGGMETDFMLKDEWTHENENEFAYDFGTSRKVNFNYVLRGGILYRLGKYAELGFDVSRKEGLNSTYQSDYLNNKPLRIGYGGHFRINF